MPKLVYINISLDCSCFSDYTLFNSSIHVFNLNEVMYMDVDNIQFMQNATINFFLPEDARGNITLIIGDENYTITLNESVKGSFSYNIENLSAGIYKVIANYSGDDIFSSNKVETILIVNNVDPTLIISADDIAVDEVAKIDVNLSTAGNVTIYVADVNYTSDEGFVSISKLSVGTYYVFAVFEGNDNYNSVSNVTCFNVLTKPVNLTVEIKDRIYIYSDVNTTGDVLVKINSTTYYSYLLEGVASISIPTNLSNGSYEVVVNFLGNNKYSANSTSSILTIERIKAEIKSVIAEHVFEGSQSLINVTMNSDELGLVIFEINGFNYTSVINDAHSLLYITLPMGINNLTVYYDGNAKYDSADAVNTKIIVKSKVDSNIVIDDVLLDIGDSVVFTAKINDVSCDDVVFMINGVEIIVFLMLVQEIILLLQFFMEIHQIKQIQLLKYSMLKK